ncbi:hypothetical protein EJB05_11510, partial [Eragrostis curvula]
MAASPSHAVVANDGVLPTDLLTEVLLRVPAKALCRFRVVCRSWRSLISDPCFARAHSCRHPLFASFSYAADREEYDLCIFDIFGSIVKTMRSLGVPDVHLSTQADLVCVKRHTPCVEREDLLLNPATGAIHALPDVSISSREVTTSYLGRVPSTGEYKVLRVVQFSGPVSEVQFAYEVVALDGSRQRWRVRVAPDPPTDVSPYIGYMAIICDVAYFFSRGEESIVMFDLATEEWRPSIVRGPLVDSCRQNGTVALFRLNGLLVLQHQKAQGCSMDLWFLMDVDKGLWTKQYSMHCDCGPDWDDRPCPLVVLDDGRLVVGSECVRVLRAFDPKTCTWADLVPKQDEECPIVLYEGNLLCPGLNPMPASSHLRN